MFNPLRLPVVLVAASTHTTSANYAGAAQDHRQVVLHQYA
jgi:hypothetical protein